MAITERIGYKTVFGRVLRAPLRLIKPGTVVPILSGAAKGMKWTVGASTHGCWLGTYESERHQLFARRIKPGMVVYDIGANVGFYTLVAARAVGTNGRVFSFEPNPTNLHFLRGHVEKNRLTTVSIIDAAVGEAEGRARFNTQTAREAGSLDANGNIDVAVVAIDSLIASHRLPPADVIKIDVEGGEAGVLRGALSLLRDRRPDLLLSIHSAELDQTCLHLLQELRYTIKPLQRWEYFCSSAE